MASNSESDINSRDLDTDGQDPTVQIAEVIANMEGKDPADLPPMYDCVDGILNKLFSNPPSPEADMQVMFSYGEYRITIEQDGNTSFRPIG